ncbi:MAG: M48 family metallopeptidase [Bacteroidales bacterium]
MSNRRSISLRVDSDKNITILCPNGLDLKYVSQFVRRKQAWIDKAMRKIEHKIVLISLDGPEKYFLLNGTTIKIAIEQSTGTSASKFEKNKLSIFPQNNKKHEYLSLICDFLAEQLTDIQELFHVLATRITPERPIDRVSWKFMKSRWGSYSSKHNISLNIALVMLPNDIQTLVIAHELCHIKEPNHSANFYEHLASYLPNHRELDKKLSRYNLMSVFQ